MASESVASELTEYGFKWGPMELTRLVSIDGRVWFQVTTEAGQQIEVYISRTGRSVRVFKRGKGELKAVPDGS